MHKQTCTQAHMHSHTQNTCGRHGSPKLHDIPRCIKCSIYSDIWTPHIIHVHTMYMYVIIYMYMYGVNTMYVTLCISAGHVVWEMLVDPHTNIHNVTYTLYTMYMYMYVHMHTQYTHIHVIIHTYTCTLYICTHSTHTYTCTHTTPIFKNCIYMYR